MMSLWDALRMNMMISYQELVRTFLSTQGEPLFMIHLRYARRRRNADDGSRESPPVEPAELGMMLDLVTKMIAVEEQGRRLSVDERNNSLKLWLAILLAAISTLTTLAVAYIK
ncbi:hypothetical protein [Enterobacter hormaechei]|uniref:hypothetical protein n=1 Tax=Enterobacter hormaechei TaxID=158836 RepID=UPI003AAA6EF0